MHDVVKLPYNTNIYVVRSVTFENSKTFFNEWNSLDRRLINMFSLAYYACTVLVPNRNLCTARSIPDAPVVFKFELCYFTVRSVRTPC